MKLLLLAIAAAVLASTTVLGCGLQGEGERCSLQSEGDCDTGLVCTEISAATDIYVCCPPSGGTSDDPYCNGQFVSPTGAGGGGQGGGGTTTGTGGGGTGGGGTGGGGTGGGGAGGGGTGGAGGGGTGGAGGA